MIRVVAIALGVLLAAPAASATAFAAEGVDLLAPADCCCPDDSGHEPAPPRFEQACCCELSAPAPGHEAASVAAIAAGDAPELAAATAVSVAPPNPRLSVASIGSAKARGPPPRSSLYAQHTSLLL